jgi:hypothetical protein
MELANAVVIVMYFPHGIHASLLVLYETASEKTRGVESHGD